MIAVRAGNHCRQERAEVLVVTDGQPFDGAVLAFGHEEHVEQAENSPAAQTVYLGQDPVLRTGLAAEAQGDHLERCGHHLPSLSWPVTSPTVPPGSITADRRIPATPGRNWISPRDPTDAVKTAPNDRAIRRRCGRFRYVGVTASPGGRHDQSMPDARGLGWVSH